MINYKIVTCYKKFLDIKNYSYNFGFYIRAFLTLTMIPFSFIFLILGKKSIRRQYFSKEPNKTEAKEIGCNLKYKN